MSAGPGVGVAPGTDPWARPPATVHRPLATLVATVVVVLLLGVVAGAVWAVVTPAMTGRVTDAGAVVTGDQLGEEFAGVGAFSLIMCALGAVAAFVTWFAARTWRGVVGFATLFVSVLLATAIAGRVGMWIAQWRFGDPHTAAMGTSFRVVPDLWLDGPTRGWPSGPWILLVCAPIAATLVYLLCVLSCRSADLGVGDGIPDELVVAGAERKPSDRI